jgi:hypothetical protein
MWKKGQLSKNLWSLTWWMKQRYGGRLIVIYILKTKLAVKISLVSSYVWCCCRDYVEFFRCVMSLPTCHNTEGDDYTNYSFCKNRSWMYFQEALLYHFAPKTLTHLLFGKGGN